MSIMLVSGQSNTSVDENSFLLATDSIKGDSNAGEFSCSENTKVNNDDCDNDGSSVGKASVFATMMNLSKTCMGTGVLTLPYAAKQGGIILFIVGLFLIGLWNIYSVQRLIHCLELLPNHSNDNEDGSQQTENNIDVEHVEEFTDAATTNNKNCNKTDPILQEQKQRIQQRQNLVSKKMMSQPPDGTSTFGKVAWHALGGNKGLHIFDAMMTIFFIGILVAYMNAIRSFLSDLPIHLWSKKEADHKNDDFYVVLMAIVIGLLSIVPDLGYLSKISAMGLFVLFLTLSIITAYGIIDYPNTASSLSYNWLPENGLSGVSNWFGCVVFGYGVVPLTYNYLESMKHPSQMLNATSSALCGVAISYVTIGIGLYTLYNNIESDVIHELPTQGIIPIITRLSMIVVILASAPLLLVPCAELLEGKLNSYFNDSVRNNENHHFSCGRVFLRLGICFICVAISILVPGFVGVLSFVGCCCVALISFVLPPIFHIRLLLLPSSRQCDNGLPASTQRTIILDIVMLLLGILASLSSSYIVFRQITTS